MPPGGPEPADPHRLDHRLASGRLRPRHLRAVGRALAHAHARAEPASGHGAEPTALLREARDALSTLQARGWLTPAEGDGLEQRLTHWLTRAVRTLLERQSGPGGGRVRRIPGRIGLDAIHVRGRRARILRPPAACDAATDGARELACVSSGLRAAGAADAAEQLLAAYALAADDYGLYAVIDAYEALAACAAAAAASDRTRARARLCPTGEGRSAGDAPRETCLGPWLAPAPTGTTPDLLLTVGGVASGKSTLAKRLVRELAAPRIVADRVREAVLDDVATHAGALAAVERAWSADFDARTLGALLQRARPVLASGRSCIVDACSAFRRQRARWASLAEEAGARLVLCTCVASPTRIRERLEARDARDGVDSGDWAAIARRLEAPFEPVGDDEPGLHLRVDTDGPAAQCVQPVLAALRPGLRHLPRRARPGWPAAVTFDCWNTLLQERNWPVAHALRVDALCAAVREEGVELERSVVSRAFDTAWQRHMDLWRQGVASGAHEVARWSLEALGLPLPALVIEHLTERFQTASHSGEVRALQGARETLHALREAGVRMALVCDTGLTPGRVVRQHLDRQGLLQPLGFEAFSDEVGVPKPDGRIFAAALQALEVDPARAVHVGDLRRTDAAGARATGMGSVRITAAFDDAADPAPDADAVVHSHAELLCRLDGWASQRG